jgi:hypothetical protein
MFKSLNNNPGTSEGSKGDLYRFFGQSNLFLTSLKKFVCAFPQGEREEGNSNSRKSYENVGVACGARSIELKSRPRMEGRGHLLMESIVILVILLISYAVLKPF